MLEPPQPSEPRPPQISKASPSHLVLACNALALASVQGAISGDMRGKHIQEKAAANAQAVTPMGAYLLRQAFAAVEFDVENPAAGTQFTCFTGTKVQELTQLRKEAKAPQDAQNIIKRHCVNGCGVPDGLPGLTASCSGVTVDEWPIVEHDQTAAGEHTSAYGSIRQHTAD